MEKGRPSSLAKAKACLDVEAKQLVNIMRIRRNIKVVIAVVPAVLNEFCSTQINGISCAVAVARSVMAKEKTSTMANARGILST